MNNALDQFFEGHGKTLSVPDVATLLGMSKQGIYHWLREGTIPGYKVGSTWLILRDDLKDRLNAGSNVHEQSAKDERV